MTREIKWISLSLRFGICLMFIGHGTLAYLGNESWIPFITHWGFTAETALLLMKIIGIADILIGVIILIFPWPPIVLWACFWAFLTALMRPISGEPWLEFIERGVNFMAPLALYFLLRASKKNASKNRYS